MRMKLKAEISVAINLLERHDLLQVKSFLKRTYLGFVQHYEYSNQSVYLPKTVSPTGTVHAKIYLRVGGKCAREKK